MNDYLMSSHIWTSVHVTQEMLGATMELLSTLKHNKGLFMTDSKLQGNNSSC